MVVKSQIESQLIKLFNVMNDFILISNEFSFKSIKLQIGHFIPENLTSFLEF